MKVIGETNTQVKVKNEHYSQQSCTLSQWSSHSFHCAIKGKSNLIKSNISKLYNARQPPRVIDRGKALTTPIMASQWKVMAGSRKAYAKYFLATGERNEVE